MATTTHDPDPERARIDEVRAHLIERIEELGRRFHAARAKLDLRAHIVAHPLASVGAAFAVGALLGLSGRAPRPAAAAATDAAVKRGIGGVIAAGVGAFALRLAKEIALKQVAESARGWWSAREAAASREPAMETFFDPT